jgi:hypothetical protein
VSHVLVPLNPLAYGHGIAHVVSVHDAVEGPLPASRDGRAPLELGPLLGWQLHFPWAKNPLPMNGGHGNRYAHAAAARNCRMTSYFLARQLPRLERIRVQLVWEVVTRGTRDEDNLGDLAKRVVDGLRDDPAKDLRSVVVDDTPDYVVREMHRIHYAPRDARTRPRAHFRLHVWPA